jgi:hypothetical protein
MEEKSLQSTKTVEQWTEVIRKTGRIPSELMPKSEEMSVRCFAQWPKQYYSSLKPAKISDVFASPVCTLGKFRRESGEEKAISLLVIILSDVTEFFNVGNSMNANQTLTTAEMILDAYGWLKIDDFKLCFSQAKRGMFGQVYRMDGNVILSWIGTYIRDRIRSADEMSYARHCSDKERDSRPYDKVPDSLYEKSNAKRT